MKLYGYWRSSAAYRVRIALNLKQLEAELISVHLVKGGGQQHAADYAKLNPQELVPTLVTDDASGDEFVLTQSMAIIDYLDERYPQSSLLPDNLELKAQVRAMAYTIACDVHPLNNLKCCSIWPTPLMWPMIQSHSGIITGYIKVSLRLSANYNSMLVNTVLARLLRWLMWCWCRKYTTPNVLTLICHLIH